MNAGAEKLSDFQGFLAEISLHQTAYGKGSSQRSGMSLYSSSAPLVETWMHKRLGGEYGQCESHNLFPSALL